MTNHKKTKLQKIQIISFVTKINKTGSFTIRAGAKESEFFNESDWTDPDSGPIVTDNYSGEICEGTDIRTYTCSYQEPAD